MAPSDSNSVSRADIAASSSDPISADGSVSTSRHPNAIYRAESTPLVFAARHDQATLQDVNVQQVVQPLADLG
jgi:hypothetical protein